MIIAIASQKGGIGKSSSSIALASGLAQTEFLTEMVKDKNVAASVRWVASNVLFIATAGKALGLEYKDILPSFRFGTPPTVQAPVEAGKAFVNAPDQYQNTSDEPNPFKRVLENKNVLRGLTNYIPAGGQISRTSEGAKVIREDGSYTPSGRKRFELESLPSKIKALTIGVWKTPEGKEYLKSIKNKPNSPDEKDAKKVKKEAQRLDSIERKLAGKMHSALKDATPGQRQTMLEIWAKKGLLSKTVESEIVRLNSKQKEKSHSPIVKAVDSLQSNEQKAIFLSKKLKEMTPEERQKTLLELTKAGLLTDDLAQDIIRYNKAN